MPHENRQVVFSGLMLLVLLSRRAVADGRVSKDRSGSLLHKVMQLVLIQLKKLP